MPSLSAALRPSRLALAAGVVGAISFGLAYRFALKYRERAGLPHRSPVEGSPADFGLAFESVEIPSGEAQLAAWFVPAKSPGRRRGAVEPRPAVAIVHGWESNRGRSMAHIRYLHAAGFHCLVIDVRGHGDNPPENLPVEVPEFAEDAAAAARWLAQRPEVSSVGLLGHSMGGAGVIVAAAAEPRVRAVVAMSAPADLVRMTRQIFAMTDIKVPAPVAAPLAYLTAAVMLVPRHHSLDDADACLAAARYRGPLLLIHGEDDRGVPVSHMELIAKAARAARTDPGSAPVKTAIVPGYGHRWLYEVADVRRRAASFLARELGGPISPEIAGELAAACIVERPSNPAYGFGAAGAAMAAAAEAREKAREAAREAAENQPTG
jgi:pimeloyl-ACP methyl ester carboxylesterase